jgi:hypothetical protein
MLGVLARFLRRLGAACHAFCGRLAARCHRPARARWHFERVLSLGGDEFSAYLQLGRLALAEGDYAGYRREMGNARAIDPERFARLLQPIDGLEPRAAGTQFEEAAERATWRSVRQGQHPRRSAVRSAELPAEGADDQAQRGPAFELTHLEPPVDGLEECRDLRQVGLHDDFASNAERDRFRRLPPIRRDDVRRADVDDLARRLAD